MVVHGVPGTVLRDSYIRHRHGKNLHSQTYAQTSGTSPKEIKSSESKCRHINMQIRFSIRAHHLFNMHLDK